MASSDYRLQIMEQTSTNKRADPTSTVALIGALVIVASVAFTIRYIRDTMYTIADTRLKIDCLNLDYTEQYCEKFVNDHRTR